MKAIFMGTPDFSVPALQSIVNAGHEIVAVYTQPPRPAGRGAKTRKSSVHSQADKLGLRILHPTDLKSKAVFEEFKELEADIVVVVAYGLLLPKQILNLPKYGCLNIHASLLPRWRGAAPIHRAVMQGDRITGVSIMQMEVGLDTGSIVLCKEVEIGLSETTAEVHDRLSYLGADLIVQVLENFSELKARPQSDYGIVYAAKIDKAETYIDFKETAEVVDRKIRGLSPFPGAWSKFKGLRLKFHCSEVGNASGKLEMPGRLISDDFEVACKIGSVKITKIQRAGRSVQSAKEFLRGTLIKKGDILG